jgi:hypothetical protein
MLCKVMTVSIGPAHLRLLGLRNSDSEIKLLAFLIIIMHGFVLKFWVPLLICRAPRFSFMSHYDSTLVKTLRNHHLKELGINYPLMGSHLQYCNRTGPRKKFN